MTSFCKCGIILLCLLSIGGCASIISATTDEPLTIDPGKRTLGIKIDDEQIETIALVNIGKAHPQLKHAHVKVHSYNAVVLLVGEVPNAEMRQLAGATAKKISLVRQVHNELQIQASTSLLSRAGDTWLTTKIKSKLLANGQIESSRTHIVTSNKSVYLMGLVTHAEAEIITNTARHTSGVQKVVRVFEYIDNL